MAPPPPPPFQPQLSPYQPTRLTSFALHGGLHSDGIDSDDEFYDARSNLARSEYSAASFFSARGDGTSVGGTPSSVGGTPSTVAVVADLEGMEEGVRQQLPSFAGESERIVMVVPCESLTEGGEANLQSPPVVSGSRKMRASSSSSPSPAAKKLRGGEEEDIITDIVTSTFPCAELGSASFALSQADMSRSSTDPMTLSRNSSAKKRRQQQHQVSPSSELPLSVHLWDHDDVDKQLEAPDMSPSPDSGGGSPGDDDKGLGFKVTSLSPSFIFGALPPGKEEDRSAATAGALEPLAPTSSNYSVPAPFLEEIPVPTQPLRNDNEEEEEADQTKEAPLSPPFTLNLLSPPPRRPPLVHLLKLRPLHLRHQISKRQRDWVVRWPPLSPPSVLIPPHRQQ